MAKTYDPHAGGFSVANIVRQTRKRAVVVAPQPPTVPTIAATAVSAGTINVSLTNPGSGATSYTLQRKRAIDSTWTSVIGLSASNFPYSISGLSASTQYEFRVFGANETGDGPLSSVVTATTQASSVVGSSGGDAALNWSAPSGWVSGGKLIIETDGTFDFGAVGPELAYLLDLKNATGDRVALSDYTVGDGCNVYFDQNGPLYLDTNVPALPHGKGIMMGGIGTSQNNTLPPGKAWVEMPVQTRGFESKISYWPQAHQDAALPYLLNQVEGYTAAVIWAYKHIWNMSDKIYNGGDTDFYGIFGYGWYNDSTNPNGNYFKGGLEVASNELRNGDGGAGPGTLTTAGSTGNPADTYRRPFPEPCTSEFLWDQGAATGDVDGYVQMHVARAGYGQIAFGEEVCRLSSQRGALKAINSSSYPGYVRGFNIPLGLHFFEADVYKAYGPGAACRVVISDNANIRQAGRKTILLSAIWNGNHLEADIRSTWFDYTDLSGLYVNIVGANNVQIASRPLF